LRRQVGMGDNCQNTLPSATSKPGNDHAYLALQPLWQEWQNEVAAEPARRWESPLPPRTHWHLAQLSAYTKEWEAALTHLQSVDELSVLESAAYKEAVDEAQRRVKEEALAAVAKEAKG